MAGAEKDLGGGVVHGVGLHRFDEADVVGVFRDVGEEGADFGAALAVAVEVVLRAHEGRVGIDEGGAVILEEVGGGQLAVAFHQLGFVIKEVEVAGGTGLEDVDDTLGRGGEVGRTHGEGLAGVGGNPGRRGVRRWRRFPRVGRGGRW